MMETKTPIKNLNTSVTQTLTPVRFLDSPKTKLDSNANICKSRLDLITKTLQDNYAKWQLAQKRGLALCTSIEAIKTRSLETSNKGSNNESVIHYPKELKPYCDKLSIIVSIFDDITKNTKDCLKQLHALNKMNGISAEIFYRTWKLEHFIEFTTHLSLRYQSEAIVKRCVMENLPHCISRGDLIRWTTAWEYPQHVEFSIDLAFLFFKEEINILKK